ncbi:DNA polymerase III subunit gamma/tau [Ferviditalea candida]|uniref:DNA-directed DNA polymerase n=1 Tax=Ferviditalea candida TaxID=3108399 RepID=A0ABU5ZJK2_9BACL|nr:DNA polymerase III subunit gamma/tau [Paenibacillaceae bacterium T2]
MSHIALYRSWRPKTFREVIGQEHITQTLQNSIRESRVSHAYLFSGPRGTGKTSTAKILAKAVNCRNGPSEEPCNQCEACRRIAEGSVMDVIELDAASNNGVDEIRDIRDKVKYVPTEVRYKVYIIDEVHMLSIGASNALLKTLEEPPAHVIFILATTEPHKLPVTIISRCQKFDFRRVSLEEQVERLRHICEQEGIRAEQKALSHIARLSDGGMRDALSLLDQIISYTGGEVSYQTAVALTGGIASDEFRNMALAIKNHDLGVVLDMIDRFMQEGKSAEKSIENLIQYFRDLLMLNILPASPDLSGRIFADDDVKELAAAYTSDQIFAIIDTLNHYQSEMKYASQPHILLELALLKISSDLSQRQQVKPERPIAAEAPRKIVELERKLEQMERQLADLAKTVLSTGGGTPPPAGEAPKTGHSAAGKRPNPGATQLSKTKDASRMKEFAGERAKPWFQEVLMQWSQVLNRVKENKITVHAWLVDGEPVSASKDTVLVAFKNTIHRETTEKPANKQLIESVLESILGKPLKLATIMLKEWNDAIQEKDDPGQTSEELKLEPEEETQGKYKEEWINQAIELFGESMVVIKDE